MKDFMKKFLAVMTAVALAACSLSVSAFADENGQETGGLIAEESGSGEEIDLEEDYLDPFPRSIRVVSSPDQKEYVRYTKNISPAGLRLEITMSDGSLVAWPEDDLYYNFAVGDYYLDFDLDRLDTEGILVVNCEDASAEIGFTVVENPIASVEVLTLPYIHEYMMGDSEYFHEEDGELRFNPYHLSGITFRVTYTDTALSPQVFNYDEDTDERGRIGGYFCFNDSPDPVTGAGDYVSYLSYNGVLAPYTLTITESPVERIEIINAPARTEYIISDPDFFSPDGSYFDPCDLEGLEFEAFFRDGTSRVFGHNDIDENGLFDGLSWRLRTDGYSFAAGDHVKVTFTCCGASAFYYVDIIESPVERIEITHAPDRTEFIYGDPEFFYEEDGEMRIMPWDNEGLEFTVYYKEGDPVSYSGQDCENGRYGGYDLEYLYDETDFAVGEPFEVTLRYLGATASYTVNIVENPIASIEITQAPVHEYFFGDYRYFYHDDGKWGFVPDDLTGLEFTVNYTDGTSTVFSISDADEYGIIDGKRYETRFDSEDFAIGVPFTVTFTYGGRSDTYEVSILPSPVDHIEIVSAPVHDYVIGEHEYWWEDWVTATQSSQLILHPTDITGLEIDVYLTSDLSHPVRYTWEDEVDSGFAGEPYLINCVYDSYEDGFQFQTGEVQVEFEYMGSLAYYTVTLKENPISNITITQAPSRVYMLGESGYFRVDDWGDMVFEPSDLTGLEFTVDYRDPERESEHLTWEDIENGEINGVPVVWFVAQSSIITEPGSVDVCINYGGWVAQYTVTVIANTIDHIEVVTAPARVYTIGEDFYFTDNGDGTVNFAPVSLEGLEMDIYYLSDMEHPVRITSSDIVDGMYDGHRISPLYYDEISYSEGDFEVEIEYCGHTDKYTVRLTASQPTHLEAASLTVTSDLSMQFYVKAEEGSGVPVMYVTCAGETEELTGTYDSAGDTYIFDFTGIGAQFMTEPLTADVEMNGNIVDTKSFSVRSYCDSLFNSTADELGITAEKFAAMKTVLADMLDYGARVQELTGYRTDDLADALSWVAEAKSPESSAPDSDYTVIKASGSDRIGSAFVALSNRFMLGFKFTVSSADRLIVTDGVTEQIFMTADLTAQDGVYKVLTADMDAEQFGTVYTVRLTDGSAVYSELTYSVNSYLNAKWNDDDNALVGVVRAMSRFGGSSAGYAATP